MSSYLNTYVRNIWYISTTLAPTISLSSCFKCLTVLQCYHAAFTGNYLSGENHCWHASDAISHIACNAFGASYSIEFPRFPNMLPLNGGLRYPASAECIVAKITQTAIKITKIFWWAIFVYFFLFCFVLFGLCDTFKDTNW